MPLRLFELLCLPILVLAILTSAHRVGARRFAVDYAMLAIAGWLGEASSMAFYRYYEYASDWDLPILRVPLLVPIIWPLVILSARDVRDALFPRAGRLAGAAIVMGIVIVDASLIEVLSVHANLWTWEEGGHLQVPLLGILAWGYFAGAADLALRRWQGRDRWLVVPSSLALAHLLIIGSWWACFRWVLRGDLGVASLGVAAIASVMLTILAWRRRRAGSLIPMDVVIVRVVAASVFVVLLFTTPPDPFVIAHVVLVAVPYCVASTWPTFARARATATV